MGRGKVELKRIENKINRQVTFSKRRAGLAKKAHEISVLCDADVALIVFSHRGKLFHYSTDSCMEMIIDRYEQYSYAEKRLLAKTNDSESSENWTLEYAKLRGKADLLQRNHRHYMGEDLDSMSQKDLQNLEQQLDSSLRLIRSRRNQLLFDSLSELQKTEKAMQQENNMLVKKIKEKEKMAAQQAEWEQTPGPSSTPFLSPQPLPCQNIGYQGEGANQTRRNDLDLNLDSLYPPCHLSCFSP